MMNLPISRSDPAQLSARAYDQLHPLVQQWVRRQGWAQLRDIQARSITALNANHDDLLIAASTAAGKTEAAFLPLLSALPARQKAGVAILYIAPLKALINDQYKRLEDLCARLETPLTRWHGDAPQGPKSQLIKRPSGVVLITPESIEAMFVRSPASVEALFGQLDAMVIDELHAFLQGPRGLHLWSLLRRIEAISQSRPRRIGLSATLGDLSHAAHWLSGSTAKADMIVAEGGSAPIKLQVRAFIDPPDSEELKRLKQLPSAMPDIAQHAFGKLRGTNNLFFAGSRANVEELADRLRNLSEEQHLPNEFYPHHGSLSKELREELEHRLKINRLPTTAIATTTLELGIDIGSVHSVAQLGPPRSLASLRQRLGRSGRREGSQAIFRDYIREPYLIASSDPLDRLHLPVVQAVAAIRLLAARFIEPPNADRALLSVAVHQLLSRLEAGGAQRADQLYRAMGQDGPFAAIERGDFVDLLRALGKGDEPMLEQSADGAIMLGPLGERLTAAHDFYANFKTEEEWRLVHHGKTLGTLPIVNVLSVGSILLFAGRRWRAKAVDDRAKVVEVASHPAGHIPKFDRLSSEPLHDRLAAEMFATFSADDIPAYLDSTAARLLQEGRETFDKFHLCNSSLLSTGRHTHLMTWRGSELNALLAILLISTGFECETFDVGVTLIDTPADEARDVLSALNEVPTIEALATYVANLEYEKYDEYIPSELLRRFWIKGHSHQQNHLRELVNQIKKNMR